MSVLRSGDGKIRFLPGLIRKRPRDPGEPRERTVRIARIVAHDGDLDWFDATVGKNPAKLRLDRVEASLDDHMIPVQSQKSAFRLNGHIESAAKDKMRDGVLQLEGWGDIALRDSSVKTWLRQADARSFERYLIKRTELGIAGGTLDLDLQSEVRDRT